MSDEGACDVVLTREQLHYLARYTAGEASACSPFRRVAPPETLPPPALDDLVRRRLLGPAGVEPRLLRVLAGLRGAAAFAGIGVRGDSLEAEGVCFFSGRRSAAIVNLAAGLRVVSPAPVAELRVLLDGVLGYGSHRASTLDVALGPSESRVLAAALDLLRGEALRDLVDGTAQPVRESDVASWILRDSHPSQWLSGHLAVLLGPGGASFEPRSVPPLVVQLAGRGLLEAADRGLSPGPTLLPLVRGLALLDRVLELRAGRDDGRAPSSAHLVAVRADSGAVLLWEAQPDGSVRWVTPSPDEMKETAIHLLCRADALSTAA